MHIHSIVIKGKVERTMIFREDAKKGMEKAICFVEEGIQQILEDKLDEQHGVSISPGATAIASLCLLALGREFDNSQQAGVNWLIRHRQEEGWGKVLGAKTDPEITRVAQLVVQASQGGLLNKLSLIEKAKQLADIVLALGQDVVPGLVGPSPDEIRFPNILQNTVREKLPSYGQPVVIAAGLLAVNQEQQGIDEGIRIIRESQMPDGSWAEDIVATSLCTLALFRFTRYDKAMQTAGKWLVQKQYKSGGWPAFDQLKNWAVGWTLAILDGHKSFSSHTLNKAREWLCHAGNLDGSFGTTPPSTHPDLDDTGIALMALPSGCEVRNRAIRLIRSLQNDDGSWGTFPSFKGTPPDIESCFPVYIQSLDVTVHIVEGLRKQRLQINDYCIQKSLHWILSQQKKDGHFQSVWFDSPIYATAQVIDLLSNLNFGWSTLRMVRQVHNARQKGVEFLLGQYNSKGDWGTSAVESALALYALKTERVLNRLVIDKTIQSILSRQTQVGSFVPAYQGIYAKGWNYEEPISTALTAIRVLDWYVNLSNRM
jgi:squalene cyclase